MTSTGQCTPPDVSHPPIWFRALSSEGRKLHLCSIGGSAWGRRSSAQLENRRRPVATFGRSYHPAHGLLGRLIGDWRLAAEVTIRGEEGNIWTGALAGYAASRTMDAATSWFYARQSEESKHREEELAPGGTLVQLGKQLGAATGRDLDDEAAGQVGLAVHRALGVSYGIAASALVKRGAAPMNAGLTVGSAAFILIDEGTAISQFSAYPVASHLRGVVGHATLGLTLGVLLSMIFRR